MIDLRQLFMDMLDLNYCVVKCPQEIPEYKEGTDVDIFCFNPERVISVICDVFNNTNSDKLILKIKDISLYQKQVDIMEGGVLNIKFDLYNSLPDYKKVNLKPALFESIVEHSVLNKKSIKVPSEIDEALIRYIEFVEYYNIRPDKIKHLDYIIEHVDEEKRKLMLEKLHHYTALPPYPSRKKL